MGKLFYVAQCAADSGVVANCTRKMVSDKLQIGGGKIYFDKKKLTKLTKFLKLELKLIIFLIFK